MSSDFDDKIHMRGPTKFSNWVIKEKLLAGGHPYPGESSDLLQSIIDSGTTSS